MHRPGPGDWGKADLRGLDTLHWSGRDLVATTQAPGLVGEESKLLTLDMADLRWQQHVGRR
jgi:hypothetical protein